MKNLRYIGVLLVIVLNMASAQAGTSFTFADLKQILKDKRPTTVDEALSYLPEDYRSEFTLVYDSKSIQYADPYNPRVIMYGQDAKLIITFTCDPRDCMQSEEFKSRKPLQDPKLAGGFDTLEVISWNEEKSEFRFHEIHFSTDTAVSIVPVSSNVPLLNQVLQSLAPYEISKKNPTKCAGCHTASHRPNWSSYNLWKGVYGSTDDITPIQNEERRLRDRYTTDSSDSRDALEYLLAKSKSRRRYQQIINLESSFKTNQDLKTAKHHNGALTALLANLNFERIVAVIKKSSHYESLKFLALKILIDLQPEYGHGYSVTPDTEGYWNLEKYFSFFPSKQLPDGFRSCLVTVDPEGRNDWKQIELLAVLFHATGLDTKAWSMVFGQTSFDVLANSKLFNTPRAAPLELVAHLILHDKELLGIFQSNGGRLEKNESNRNYPVAYISDSNLISLSNALQLKSVESLSKTYAQWDENSIFTGCTSVAEGESKQALQTCQSCHGDPQSYYPPHLPFNNPTQLTDAQLQEIESRIRGDKGKARMPLNGPYMNEQQQKEFMQYLNQKREQGSK